MLRFRQLFVFAISYLLMIAPVCDARIERRQDSGLEGCILSASASAQMQSQLRLFKTTGYPSLDANLNNTIGLLGRYYGLNPAFFLFDDSSSPNAFATPTVYQPGFTDGSVVMGSNLLVNEFRSSGSGVNFSITGILAHEVAHILQFRLNEQLSTNLKEIEADYMAGWFMSQLSRLPNGYVWNAQAAQQNLLSFYSKGDVEFNSPNHHGTPEERAAAVQAGFTQINNSVRTAFAHAHDYVNNGPETSQPTPKPQAEERGDFCPALKSLISSAYSNFVSIRGQRDSGADNYQSRKSLPASNCSIIRTDFNCDFKEDASDGDFKELVSKVSKCLPDWPTKTKSSNSIEFNGPRDIEIDVEIDRHSVLTLWIYNFSD